MFTVSCASVQHGGITFSSHDGYDFHNVPKHGFAEVDQDQKVCYDDSAVKGGYWVQLREPNRGESESEYKAYIEAEEIRAGLCAEVATWCSTNLNTLCSPTDDQCIRDKGSMGIRNTCRIKVTDSWDKPHLKPITTMVGQERWIVCGTAQDEYTGPIAKTTSTNKAWDKSQKSWEQFCLKNRSKDECDAIVTEYESRTYFISPSSNRWAVQITNQSKPTVTRDGDRIFGTIEIDLTPVCKSGLIEPRH
jgi:hypothetical protein